MTSELDNLKALEASHLRTIAVTERVLGEATTESDRARFTQVLESQRALLTSVRERIDRAEQFESDDDEFFHDA